MVNKSSKIVTKSEQFEKHFIKKKNRQSNEQTAKKTYCRKKIFRYKLLSIMKYFSLNSYFK